MITAPILSGYIGPLHIRPIVSSGCILDTAEVYMQGRTIQKYHSILVSLHIHIMKVNQKSAFLFGENSYFIYYFRFLLWLLL